MTRAYAGAPGAGVDETGGVDLHIRELRRLEARLQARSQEAADLLWAASGACTEALQRADERERSVRRAAAQTAEDARAARRAQTQSTSRVSATRARATLAQWPSVAATGGWTDPRWGAQQGPLLPDGAVRIGTLAGAAELDGLAAMVPSVGGGHVRVIAPTPADRDRALAVVDTVLLRTIAAAPPGRIRFRIHDPAGLGATLSAYSQFDRNRVAHGNASATSRELEESVHALTTHATEISATYLRGIYRTLRECLADDPYADVGFELLVLLDAPRGIEPPLLERISVLAGQAADRGIMLLTLEAGGSGLDLGPAAVRVEVDADGTARMPDLTRAPITLDPPAPGALLRRVAGRSVAARTALTFLSLHEPASPPASSAERLETPIGRAGRELVAVRMGDDPVHGLVAGIAGSGKSNLLRTFIYGLARRYDSSELQLYLLDFKEGVEFQEFAPTPIDRTFLPQAAVVAVNSSREFGLEVLRHLNKVIAQRYAMFSASGSPPKLSGLRRLRSDVPSPRIVLVVDEFQRMFDVDDALSAAAVDELVNIAKQGRAAGVHFLLATQSIGDVGAGTAVGLRLDGVFKNAALRIGMRLSETESRELFSSASNTAAATIHEAGVAIVNTSGGAEAFNQRTVVALLADDVALEERRSAVTRATTGRIPPRTFDGAQGADASANRALRAAIRGRGRPGLWQTWPAQALRVGVEDPRGAEGVATSLGRDARRNVAVIGAGLANAVSIVQWSLVGLAAGRSEARFVLVDLMRSDDSAEYGVPADAVDATRRALERLGAVSEIHRSDATADLAGLLAGAAGGGPTVVGMFGGFERLRGGGQLADPDGFDTAEDALRRTLADGPNEDVHVIGAFSTRDDFEVLDRGQAFGLRAYLQLPAAALMALSGFDLAVPGGRLALWHDLLNARAPEPVHCYTLFDTAGIPSWLTR